MNKLKFNSHVVVLATLMIMAVAVPGLASCTGQTTYGPGNETYTTKIDSDSVGEVFGPVQYKIGDTYLGEKQYVEAIKAYTAAIRNGYTGTDIYVNRGTAYLALGLYSGAIADASISLDIDPSQVRAYELRGRARSLAGEYAAAVTDFTKAIEIAPGNKGDYLGRGVAYIGVAEYDYANTDFDKAIALDPKYPDAYYWRALVNEKYLPDYYSALNGYTKVIDLNGAHLYDAYNGRGETYFRLNEFDEAISDFSLLLEIDPDYWLAYYNRALCYTGVRQYQKAADDFKRYVALDVNNKYGEVQSADYLATYYKPFLEGYIR